MLGPTLASLKLKPPSLEGPAVAALRPRHGAGVVGVQEQHDVEVRRVWEQHNVEVREGKAEGELVVGLTKGKAEVQRV